MGPIQRAILALVEADPNGAWRGVLSGQASDEGSARGCWAGAEPCGAAGDVENGLYPRSRALAPRRMQPCERAQMLPNAHRQQPFEPGGYVFQQVERAKRGDGLRAARSSDRGVGRGGSGRAR